MSEASPVREPQDSPAPSVLFERYEDALREARRRRAQGVDAGFITRVERSPYGGFLVRSWPVSMLVNPHFRYLLDRNRFTYSKK